MIEADDERIRVLIVGDSPVARAGLEAAIADTERFDVVGTCSPANASALFESSGAACILMESGAFGAWSARDAASGNGSPPGSRAVPGLQAAALTPREVEVLRLLADGASNKVIAYKLGISDHTVKFHVTSILSKLNAGTRTEAVTLGVRMGLVYL